MADMQNRTEWVGTVIAIALILAAGILALIVVRILLANWIGKPLEREDRPRPELTVERSGTARGDARAFFGWLMRWLRDQLSLGRARTGTGPRGAGLSEVAAADAWAAYQRLLAWAEAHGSGRRPAETTGQLQSRLLQRVPEAADTVELVTSTYEWERYGEVHPATDRLRRIRQALATLVDR
jgi:hypothetical protein